MTDAPPKSPRAWIFPVITNRFGLPKDTIVAYVVGCSDFDEARAALESHLGNSNDVVRKGAALSDETVDALDIQPGQVRMV